MSNPVYYMQYVNVVHVFGNSIYLVINYLQYESKGRCFLLLSTHQ